MVLSFAVAAHAQYGQQFPQAQQPYPPQQPYPQQPYPQQPYPQQPYGVAPGAPQTPYGPQPMAAAPPLVSSVDGAIQLGFGTALVQHLSSSLSPDSGAKISQSDTNWGVFKNPFSLEAGYGLNDNILIGGLLQLGGETGSNKVDKVAAVDSSSFTLLIGPKIDYLFMPDSRWNPFASAVVALQVGSTKVDPLHESRTVANLQLRGGIRYFLLDQLSIDPTFFIGAAFGSATQTVNDLVTNYGVTTFDVGLTIGLSAWLK